MVGWRLASERGGVVLAAPTLGRPLARRPQWSRVLSQAGAGMSMSSPNGSPSATLARPMAPSERRTARIAGVFFVLTFVASIPAVLLYDPVLNNTGYILGAGADTRVQLGAFLEVILVIANIGTAVVLFPILRRQSEAISLGYVASRVVESTIIAVGLMSLLSVVTLRQDLAGAAGTDPATLDTVG